MEKDLEKSIFKQCPMCGQVWKNRDAFIGDDSLDINGYQVNFEDLEQGIFYFTHKVEGCFSTMAVEARHFYDLNPAIPAKEKKKGTQDCPAYCLFRDNLERCPAQCECAFVRDLIDILREHKKQVCASRQAEAPTGNSNR